MERYIELDVLVAQINRLMKWQEPIMSDSISFNAGYKAALNKLLAYLDTLEVKKVDLDEEINNYFNRISHFGKIHLTPEYDNIKVSTMTIDGFASIAKHFFELGYHSSRPRYCR